MVEVFKTNVKLHTQATTLLNLLSKHFPAFNINFDLDDCDKILRVEGSNICSDSIIGLLNVQGYQCQPLV